MLVLLMGVIYELRRRDGIRCHDIDTKFHKVWFCHSKVNREVYTYRNTDNNVIS
jgi:hypothetical protein